MKNRLDTTFVTHAKVARPSRNTTIGCAGASTRTITFRLSTGAYAHDLQFYSYELRNYFDFLLDNRLSTLALERAVAYWQQLDKKIAWNVRFCLTNGGRAPGPG